MNNSTSIIEVAKAAGLSTATVSRVLNDLPGVRPQTAEQVKRATEILNYRPRRSGRPAKSDNRAPGRSLRAMGNIAVIICGSTRQWLEAPAMIEVLAGLQRAAGDFGRRLLLEEIPIASTSEPPMILREKCVDGAIAFATDAMSIGTFESALRPLVERIPIIWGMGAEDSSAGIDQILPNNIRVGSIARDYLQSCKRRHLAFITTEPHSDFMRLRGQGFLNSARDAEISATCYLIGQPGPIADCYGPHSIMAPTLGHAVAALAASNPRPDGIFVGCDRTTVRVYPMLARHGIHVGRNITVVSCGNEEMLLSSLNPRPASIDIGAAEIGFRAVAHLVARIQKSQDRGPIMIQVQPRLVLPGP